jgi:hypothetical protein
VTWVHEHSRFLKDIDSQVLLGTIARNPEGGIPAAFYIQQFALIVSGG